VEHKVRTASDRNQIRCEIATTYEQTQQACAIRANCFMDEHGVKSRQTFDGNDDQAAHMIANASDEPIGALRVRWFRDFAKFEHTAFREGCRNTLKATPRTGGFRDAPLKYDAVN